MKTHTGDKPLKKRKTCRRITYDCLYSFEPKPNDNGRPWKCNKCGRRVA